YGDNTVATGSLSSALGPSASATFANSTAIGNGAATTRINQVAIGTGSNTYTLAGINSAASLAAQSGTLKVVTTDAAGNLPSALTPTTAFSAIKQTAPPLQTKTRRRSGAPRSLLRSAPARCRRTSGSPSRPTGAISVDKTQ